jgi:hypothetical protein
MRESLVFTNISDRAINEAFNIQMRQFLRFLKRRIDELVIWRSEFAEDEIQSELRDFASDGAKLHQMRWRAPDYLGFSEIDLAPTAGFVSSKKFCMAVISPI